MIHELSGLTVISSSKASPRLNPMCQANRLPMLIFVVVSGSLGTTVSAADPPETALRERAKPSAVALFNGKNLDGWYTWLVDAKYEDPRKVFSVVNGQLRISGDGFGYLATRESYRNYHLVVEYRWGQRNYSGRQTPSLAELIFTATHWA